MAVAWADQLFGQSTLVCCVIVISHVGWICCVIVVAWCLLQALLGHCRAVLPLWMAVWRWLSCELQVDLNSLVDQCMALSFTWCHSVLHAMSGGPFIHDAFVRCVDQAQQNVQSTSAWGP